MSVRVCVAEARAVRVTAGTPAAAVAVTGPAVVGAPEYSGPYDITPLFSVQTLPTAKRLMRQDVTVKKIPQYEVSNDYGGYTLIIGDEYYNAQ